MTIKPTYEELENRIRVLEQALSECKAAQQDLRQTGETLWKKENKYKTILQTANEGFWLTDLNGGILETNAAYCQMSGFSEQDVCSMSITDLEVSEEAQKVSDHIQKKDSEKHCERFETRHRRKDGTVFDVDVSVRYLSAGDGEWVVFIRDITELKKSRKLLYRNEQKLRAMVDNTYQFSGLLDPEGRMLMANKTAMDFAGVTEEELLGRYFWDTKWWNFDPQIRALCKDAVKRAAEGEFVRMEIPNMSLTGKTKMLDFSIKPVIDEHGDVIYLIPEGSDISDLKEVIHKLEQNEKKLMALLDNSFQLTGLLDSEGRILMANKTAMDFAGVTEEELLGRYFWDAKWWTYNPDIQSFCKDAVQRAMKGEAILTETQIMSSAGNARIIDFSLKPVFDEHGNVIYMVPEGRDITDLKEFIHKLELNEKKLKALLDNSFQLTGLLDAEGQILMANKTAMDFAGVTENDLLGRYFWDAKWWTYDPERQNFCKNAVQRAMKGEPTMMETPIMSSDGNLRLIDFSLKPVFDEHDNVMYMVCEGRDITMHKEAEKEKKSLEIQLHQAQKMEAVGRLAGGVAHDFNNMLNVILGYSEMALDQTDTSQQMFTHLQQIMEAGKRSTEITRQLLAFARRQTIAPKILDLNKTVANMFKMIQRLIGEDICLNWIPATNVYPVKIDPSQVDQILVNLCVNARDAIDGVGKITIETGKVSFDEDHCKSHLGFVPGDFTLLSVSDDGCGMDKDTLQNIFEPFFTTKGIHRGTGLGLATVYGIVKQNQGFINVYSEPEFGTTFRIYFPRNETSEKRSLERNISAPDVGGSETILLVEDEKMILDMTKMFLKKLGYHVLTAITPKQAIDLAGKHQGRIHLLITDVIMPEMNGNELAKNLLPLYPTLKHLFMSGYTSNIIAHHGVLKKGIHFIQKPFTKKELSVKVREALNNSNG